MEKRTFSLSENQTAAPPEPRQEVVSEHVRRAINAYVAQLKGGGAKR
jgi:hypothetical protein